MQLQSMDFELIKKFKENLLIIDFNLLLSLIQKYIKISLRKDSKWNKRFTITFTNIKFIFRKC